MSSLALRRFLIVALLCLGTGSSLALAQGESPRTAGIHVVLAIDTKSGPKGTKECGEIMKFFFEIVAQMGIDVEITKIDPQAISPGEIIATIKKLNPQEIKNKTLFFYYAGHGVRARQMKDGQFEHVLKPSGLDLPRSDLLAEIKAKNPRLAIVITDCCNVQTNLLKPPRFFLLPPYKKAIDNLLLQHRGVVDINASGPNQAAFYRPDLGGLFTNAFRDLFHPKNPGACDRNKDGFIDWNEAVDDLRAGMRVSFGDFKRGVVAGDVGIVNPNDVVQLRNQGSQDPQVFELAVRSDQSVRPLDPPGRPRKTRFGASLANDPARVGIVVVGIVPGSPATKVRVWKNGVLSPPVNQMLIGDTITSASGKQIRNIEDFFRVLDSIPDGEKLDFAGRDQRTKERYRASVILDKFD
jgi:Caspase domain